MTKPIEMSHKQLNRLTALFVFVASELLYFLTMAPTFSFWDCGEFIASAYTMGVPHPPGSPMFMLIGRVMILLLAPIPGFSDIGTRLNFVSATFSALTVLLTYLIIIQLITVYRKKPADEWTLSEKISAYASGVIGALSLAFSDSFWFNAVEAEVYAASSFFTAIVVWLMLKWNEVSDEEGNERWLMIVMYMMGVAIGVHLLNLLTLFGLALIYYYKRYDINLYSFAGLVVVSVLLFFLIYPGIIKLLPQAMDKISPLVGLLVVIALVAGIWYTEQNRMRIANTVVVSLFLVVIGYTSYGIIYFRAQANPPLNENDPSTMAKLYSYLNREQYGDSPIVNLDPTKYEGRVFPRRWSPEPQHQENYKKYSSDFDYFIRYQVNHMYNRYLAWQFIGRANDIQDAGWDFTKYWGLPFLLGIFGMIFHLRKDWKMGLVVMSLFILTGIAIIFYLNQTEPQPRERDYSYVGSFFAFAIWIGIGIDALFETIRESIQDEQQLTYGAGAVALAGLLFVNGRMLQVNYYEHSRAGNYVPNDYAYNLLNSCEKDAILFTNGDNDTFPLWYLQEVERMRTDVRVVNLSLANTDWYVLQLKHAEPRGAKKVPLSISDEKIRTMSYDQWSPRDITLPVPKQKMIERDEFKNVQATDLLDTVRWRFNPTVNAGQGRGYIRAQDLVVYDIITTNKWERPIYFAITVSDGNRVGIDNYLRMDGLAYKVVPMRSGNSFDYVEADIMYEKMMKTYRYRNINNPSVYYDENTRRLVSNYRNLFQRLAAEYVKNPDEMTTVKSQDGTDSLVSNRQLAVSILDKAQELLPTSMYEIDYRLTVNAIQLYSDVGAKDKAVQLVGELEKETAKELARLKAGATTAQAMNEYQQSESQMNLALYQAYKNVGDYKRAIALLEPLTRLYGNKEFQQELAMLKLASGDSSAMKNLMPPDTAKTAPPQKP